MQATANPEVERLRERFPDWHVASRWTGGDKGGGGPGAELYYAHRAGAHVSAFSPDGLARAMREADRGRR